MNVLGQQKEAGVPGWNPHKHRGEDEKSTQGGHGPRSNFTVR